MIKKFWLILSTLTALLGAFFLYDGQKLLFSFHDRRQGVLLLTSGACLLLFYAHCLRQIFPKQNRPHTPARDRLQNGIFPGFLAAGLAVWFHRYDSLWYIAVSALAAWFLVAALIFILQTLLQNRQKRLPPA